MCLRVFAEEKKNLGEAFDRIMGSEFSAIFQSTLKHFWLVPRGTVLSAASNELEKTECIEVTDARIRSPFALGGVHSP